ncbi:MAG: hypothetical protein RBT65_19450 [Methanolobus sp.]|nr:hypothetical protein [Methanolobus sp.]
MPKKIHRQLTRTANKKGLKGKRKDAYVYGTLAKIDKRKKKKK